MKYKYGECSRDAGPRPVAEFVQYVLFSLGESVPARDRDAQGVETMERVTEDGGFGRRLDFSVEGALALEVRGVRKVSLKNGSGEAVYFDCVTHCDEPVSFGKITRIPMLEYGARYIIESKGRKPTGKGTMYDVEVYKLNEKEWNDLRGGVATAESLIARSGADKPSEAIPF